MIEMAPMRLIRLIPALLLVTAGCSSTRPLMPTPHLYEQGHETLFENLDPALQTSTVDLLYVTDRAPETDAFGGLTYGFGRSDSAAFGSAVVELGHDLSWDEVLIASSKGDRDVKLDLTLESTRELGRFPDTPYGLIIDGEKIEQDPEVLVRAAGAEQSLRTEVERRLALTPLKEAFVFIHGYANTFEEGAFKSADGWHFMGREGVPVLYTWAAGHGGITGYAYDRESGEFTIFHLKELLRLLARIEALEAIHIISHSRGTDVATTALRELVIEARAAGLDPINELKIANLVLAAPDLDLQVVKQRFIAERVGLGIGRVTIYTSQGDKALRLAEKLFSGTRRVGRVDFGDLPEDKQEEVRALRKITNVDFVDFEGEADPFGHSYFSTNPAVSSDLILLLRYGRAPGAENGRPLTHLGANFWRIEAGYPRETVPDS